GRKGRRDRPPVQPGLRRPDRGHGQRDRRGGRTAVGHADQHLPQPGANRRPGGERRRGHSLPGFRPGSRALMSSFPVTDVAGRPRYARPIELFKNDSPTPPPGRGGGGGTGAPPLRKGQEGGTWGPLPPGLGVAFSY